MRWTLKNKRYFSGRDEKELEQDLEEKVGVWRIRVAQTLMEL